MRQSRPHAQASRAVALPWWQAEWPRSSEAAKEIQGLINEYGHQHQTRCRADAVGQPDHRPGGAVGHARQHPHGPDGRGDEQSEGISRSTRPSPCWTATRSKTLRWRSNRLPSFARHRRGQRGRAGPARWKCSACVEGDDPDTVYRVAHRHDENLRRDFIKMHARRRSNDPAKNCNASSNGMWITKAEHLEYRLWDAVLTLLIRVGWVVPPYLFDQWWGAPLCCVGSAPASMPPGSGTAPAP